MVTSKFFAGTIIFAGALIWLMYHLGVLSLSGVFKFLWVGLVGALVVMSLKFVEIFKEWWRKVRG